MPPKVAALNITICNSFQGLKMTLNHANVFLADLKCPCLNLPGADWALLPSLQLQPCQMVLQEEFRQTVIFCKKRSLV